MIDNFKVLVLDYFKVVHRKQATNFATWVCKTKPKTVMKHDFI